MKKWLLILFVFVTAKGFGQLLTWSPEFPTESSTPIVITVDATKGNQGLQGYNPTDVYVHIGLITNKSADGGDWKHTLTTWGSTDPTYKAASLGGNKWSFTITGGLRNYFNITDPTEIVEDIAILFRNGAGTIKQANADNTDMYVPVYTSSLAVRFTAPPFQPKYIPEPETITKNIGDAISISAKSNLSSDLKIFLNGTQIQTATGTTTISANPTLITGGNQKVLVQATSGAVTAKDSFNFFVSGSVNIAPLPPGVQAGINYISSTSATLVLYAPNKGRVAVIGDIPGSNWVEQSMYQMNKTSDGNYWWITLTGLTAGQEYSFQYLVNGTLRIGDPYSEKILDPYNDISSTTYPGLKPYPTGQTGVVSILETNAPEYTWDITSFTRPDKRNLMIYELLVRDFVAAHDWNTLSDTLSYLKKLGINAIEIMPFNEFEGNLSWGYNPDYYLAPDKYYGPASTLKEFIDSCHKNGIAVIMDIALNHSFGMSPMVKLYWDESNNRPAPDNPWFNTVAKHAYNVGYDMNHESLQTKYFVGRVLSYWLEEYKIDGFRFDLSKGFTQTQTCDNNGANCNVATWGNYDQSRIDIWKGYYDTVQDHSAGAYCILEHFAANSEETVLSNYGMLLWGNANYNYNEATMGYSPGWDFSYGIASVRGWSNPYLVTYMESHDEERLMYKNINYGNSSGSYNIKDTTTALARMELAAAFFFTIPGPKMIWQFGELGYDYPINYCGDSTIDPGCRTDNKPIRWDYFQQPARKSLYNTYSHLLHLRQNTSFTGTFISNSIQQSLSGAFKWIVLNGNPGKVVVIGNFDVIAQGGNVTFPAAGTWYDYLNGTTITATGASQFFNLQPGEFHVFTNIQVPLPVTLSHFSASAHKGFNLLEWTSENEENLDHYEILSSTNGTDFQPIGEVEATGTGDYSWQDETAYPNDIIYYRLKSVDIDGTAYYSNIVTVRIAATSTELMVFPNPFRGNLKLKLSLDAPAALKMILSSPDGKVLVKEKLQLQAGNQEVDIPQTETLPAGIYLLQLERAGKSKSVKIIKLK